MVLAPALSASQALISAGNDDWLAGGSRDRVLGNA